MSIKAEAECNSCGVVVPVEQAMHWIMINPLSSIGDPIGKPMHLCREKCTPEFAAKYPGAELAGFLVETAPRVEVITRPVRIDITSDAPVSPRLARTTIAIRAPWAWFRPRQFAIPAGTADAPLERVQHPVTGHHYMVRVGAESAKDWVICDFRIGNQSQFAQSGEIAGDLIREMESMDFARCPSDMTMSIDVRYIGKNPEGEVFTATIVGEAPEGGLSDVTELEPRTVPGGEQPTPANMVMVRGVGRVGPVLDVQQPFKVLPVRVQTIAKNLEMWFTRFDNESHRTTKRAPMEMLRTGAQIEVAYIGPDDKIEVIIDPAKNNNVVHADGPGRVYNIVSLVLTHTRKLAPATHPPRYIIRVIDPVQPFLEARKRDEAKLTFEMPAEFRGVPAPHAADASADPKTV